MPTIFFFRRPDRKRTPGLRLTNLTLCKSTERKMIMNKTTRIIIDEITSDYLDVPPPYFIVFPGIPVIFESMHYPYVPYTPRLVDDLVNEMAVWTEVRGHTTFADDEEDIPF